MSLLEVLISVFVLSVGLLGLAALIPVGRFAIVESAKADRSSACAWAGMQDAKVQDAINVAEWMYFHPGFPAFAGASETTPDLDGGGGSANPPLNWYESYAIDPLFVGTNLDKPMQAGVTYPPGRFPYHNLDGYISATYSGNTYYLPDMGGTAYPPVRTMQRITLDRLQVNGLATLIGQALDGSAPRPSLTDAQNYQQGLFGRLFTWHDDILFDIPEDERLRPRRDYQYDDGTTLQFGTYPGSFANFDDARVREFEAAYTYLITVTPATTEMGMGGSNKRRFEISVVVFYKRDLQYTDPSATTKPGERMVTANLLGGGDMKLTVPAATGAEYLELRENEWFMLCGEVFDWNLPTPAIRHVFKWYRVLSATEIESVSGSGGDYYQRYVTVAGPDWDVNQWIARDYSSWPSASPAADLDSDGSTPDVRAALFTGCIGVYTTTVDLDTSLLR